MKLNSPELLSMKFKMTKTWYHGTFVDAYNQIQKDDIDVDYSRKLARKLDFGPGFYLTSNKEQAERFTSLKQKQLGTGRLARALPPKQPCVIEYELDMEALLKNFIGEYYLEFDSRFADFIAHNRSTINLLHENDFVYGKVADGTKLNDFTEPYLNGDISVEEYLHIIWNERYELDDQLSIHNQKICDILKEIKMYRV